MSDPIGPDEEMQEWRNSSLATFQKASRKVGRYYSTPDTAYGSVWCAKCGQACEFEETFAHNTANPGRSRVYIRAYCHGETCDVFMTFQQWHENAGRRINVFDYGPAIEEPQEVNPAALKTAKTREVSAPVLLLCWHGKPSI